MLINRILLLATGCFFVFEAAHSQSVDVPQDPTKFHLFLLAGQSNMAGRGKVTESDRKVDPHVLTLNRKGIWVAAVDPIHFDKPGIAGVGLGKTFAKNYAASHPGITVGLIPCAVGGSPISSWEPGGYHPSTKTHPYDTAILRTQLAMKEGTLKGVLWHQGESDCKAGLSVVYKEKLYRLIERFRTNFNDDKLPFIAGQMGQFKERPWNADKKRVDSVHETLPSQLSLTGFVNSKGLKHKGDNIHFDSESYRELGRRYHAAFKAIEAAIQN
ncbi:MAG TPA: sialate O-acetylesterase [Rhodopirellula sp.]|nr:MAG: hypothetical protein CBD74_03220 [Saprospirales bacterium TMED214]HBV62336.1 sialate O-acetylesterase [Rhodopirellula sp.]